MGSEGRIRPYAEGRFYRDLKARARTMRKHPTPAEDLLWQQLRRKRFAGFHFRRQHPIVRYIVDFYCAEAKLVVEIDGAVHDRPGQEKYDIERQEFLESLGLRVMRFKNNEVMRGTDNVVKAIADALEATPPHRYGERG